MKKRLISLLLVLLLAVGMLPAGAMAADVTEEPGQTAAADPEADAPENDDASGEDKEIPAEDDASGEDEEAPAEDETSGEGEEAPAEDEISGEDEEEAPAEDEEEVAEDTDAPLTLSLRSAPAEITSAADLAALAEAVNCGESCEGQTITLAKDIVLTEEWTPIGTSDNPFSGTFDGGHYTISGLNVDTDADNAGLFGYLAAEGTIENLVVDGEVTTNGRYAGGIVGTCEGTVENCGNRAAVTGNACIGGIAGQAVSGSISGCYNTAALSGNGIIGGIVGVTSSVTENCYNTGTISGGERECGGIVGQGGMNGTESILNCYNTGTVTADGEYVGAIIGQDWGIWQDFDANCFYLEGSAPKAGFGEWCEEYLKDTSVTASELSTLAASLGEAFEDGANGYPVLTWEKNVTTTAPAPVINVTVTFAVTPADADIRVQDLDNERALVSANEDGTYTLRLGGNYYYGVTADGYTGKEENITVTGNQTITVTLEKESSGPVTPEPDVPDEDPAKEHRDKALAELKAQYGKFNKNDYTAANWAKLEAAYEKGVAAIKAAKPAEPPYIENNIIAALNAAIAAMQDVKSDPAGTVTVAVSMDANTLGLGYIIKPTLVEIPRNTQASVVITDLLKENGYSWEITGTIENGFYLAAVKPVDQTGVNIAPFILNAVGGESSIIYDDRNNTKLEEFDYYTMSGWMYSVNGSFPGVGAAEWNMGEGEVMRWQFTVYGYGADLNADNSTWGASSIIPTLGNKDELTWAIAELRAEKSDAELEKIDAYKKAMEVLQDPEATQRQIDAAYDALNDLGSSSGGGSTGPADSVDVTAKPAAAVDKDGNANVSMEDEDISSIIAQAKEENSDKIVIEPEVEGDATKVSVELPKSSVGDIARDTGAALSVRTDVGTVTIPAAGLEDINKQSGSKVTISAESLKSGDGKTSGETRIEVAVDGRAVEKISGGITVTVPAAETGSGNVLVLVNADGTEEIVKKSVVNGKTAAGIVDGSCTVKVVDNSKHFDDTADHWGKDAIAFVSSHELFSGVTENTFAPDASMSRAMFTTVLYRLEDAVASGSNAFADVPEGSWYTDAVTWARESGIVTGTGSGFVPNDNVTREQLAAMLYRYAKAFGMSTAASGDLTGFSDGGKTSDWARDAVSWAVGSGLISSKGSDVLDPTGSVTRAEVAVIMQRLIGLMVK